MSCSRTNNKSDSNSLFGAFPTIDQVEVHKSHTTQTREHNKEGSAELRRVVVGTQFYLRRSTEIAKVSEVEKFPNLDFHIFSKRGLPRALLCNFSVARPGARATTMPM